MDKIVYYFFLIFKADEICDYFSVKMFRTLNKVALDGFIGVNDRRNKTKCLLNKLFI